MYAFYLIIILNHNNMYCRKCGKEISENSFYCKFCGNSVKGESMNINMDVIINFFESQRTKELFILVCGFCLIVYFIY